MFPSNESDSVELWRCSPLGLSCIHRTVNNFLRKSTYHTQHQLSPNGRATGRDMTPIPHALPFGSSKNNQIPAQRKSYQALVTKQLDQGSLDERAEDRGCHDHSPHCAGFDFCHWHLTQNDESPRCVRFFHTALFQGETVRQCLAGSEDRFICAICFS